MENILLEMNYEIVLRRKIKNLDHELDALKKEYFAQTLKIYGQVSKKVVLDASQRVKELNLPIEIQQSTLKILEPRLNLIED